MIISFHISFSFSPQELHKIKRVHPEAHVVLRIAVDDSQSVCRFNSKFGARREDWAGLLRAADNLGLNVVGISFHVGSGCRSTGAFVAAVESAREAFDVAAEVGLNLSLLDIGGGFPGTDYATLTFEDICEVLNPALDRHFPESSGVRIIAEPGRFFVAESHILATAVIARRNLGADAEVSPLASMQDDDGAEGAEVAYYLNDGVYGSFNCVIFDHAVVTPLVLQSEQPNRPERPSKVFGPTCDSMDCILENTPLPELESGDWLWFPDMGAYTRSAASKFNGFDVPECRFVLTPFTGPDVADAAASRLR